MEVALHDNDAMLLTRALAYDAPADAVVAMLQDPAFWDRVAVATGALTSATSVVAGDGIVTVVTDQLQAVAGVPAFAKKLVGDSTRAIITAEWRGQQAAYRVETPGKPTAIAGTVRVEEQAGGAVVRYALDVTATVPMVGGKLEKLVAELTGAGFDKEAVVGRAWLATSGTPAATASAEPVAAPVAPVAPSTSRTRQRVRTMLDADQTITKLDATADRLNDTLDTFGALLTDFTAALHEFNESVRGFNGTVGEFQGVVDKADGLLSRADLLLTPLANAQQLGDQLKAAGQAAGSVAASAVRRGVAVGKGLTPGA